MVSATLRSRPPGRNDPCPCGSGKKYKRCCLAIEAAESPPRAPEDVLAEVRAADAEGAHDRALAVLEAAREVCPGGELCRALVERYISLPPHEAEEALRTWWNLDHDRFSGGGLAQVLYDQARGPEALDILEASQGVDAWPRYWRLLATLREETGQSAGALTAMELYTRLAPDDAEAWMQLAAMQQRSGEIERALASLRRAADAEPDSLAPRSRRLQLLAHAGRWREARDLGESLIEASYKSTSPDETRSIHDIVARACFILDDTDRARLLWTAMLDDRPDDLEVRLRLADLELQIGRHRSALQVLDGGTEVQTDVRVAELRLRATLAMAELDEAAGAAACLDDIDPGYRAENLVGAYRAVENSEYAWALQQLEGDPPAMLADVWRSVHLDCLVHLGRWAEVPAVLRGTLDTRSDVLVRAGLAAMAAGKLDLAQRLTGELDDQQSLEVKALTALLAPLRQSRRTDEARRQQRIDAADKQRWAAESRDLRRRVRELEQHNAALSDALARSQAASEQLLEIVGVSASDGLPEDWEAQVRRIGERAHKAAMQQERVAAENRLRSMLGQVCWDRLSEGARLSLLEGEWLYEAVEGENRDYRAALLQYAGGLELAFKDAVFVPVREQWSRSPGNATLLETDGLDPSLGPFVRYVLHNGHLTLGSMAAALDRMSDARRQGVAIGALRQQLGLSAWDVMSLADWKRIADRLAQAAEARNQAAHAAPIDRHALDTFRDIVLGSQGLLRALD